MTTGKRLYITLSVLVFVAVLALLFQWGVRGYLQPRIGALLQQIIVRGSDSLYRFDQASCTVDVWTGTVALGECRLSLDSARYEARRVSGALPPLTVEMRFKEIRVTGLKVWTWLLHKRVDCGRLTLVGAEVSLYRHPGPVRRATPNPTNDLYALIRPLSVRVGEVLLGDVRVSYDNGDSARPFRWAFERCDLRLRDILVDSTTVSDSTRIAYARVFTVGMKKVSLLVGKQLYRLTLGALVYDFEDREAKLSDFSLRPVLDAAAFYKKVGHQEDRYAVRIGETRLAGLNISELLQYNSLHVDSAWLDGPEVDIFHDRTLPPSGRSKLGNFPSQLLLRVPLDILVRSIRTEGGRIRYGEKDARTKEVGTLAFDEVRGRVTNVTNVADAIRADPWWQIDLRGVFLGHSPITGLFKFDMRNPSGRFSVDASLQSLDAPALDSVMRPLAKASMRSFHLDRLDAHITGDEGGAKGDVRLRYDHLRVELLKTGPDSGSLSKKPLLSFLVNRIAVREDNPSGTKPERTAPAVSTRDPQKSFFNLIWKTLYDGVRKIVLKV